MESLIVKFNSETPWIWYISRASGLIGFIFLWITVFLGLAIRNPLLKKIVKPVYSFDLHCFMAALAVFWALVHATSFLFHGNFALGIKDIFIPFYSKTNLVNSNYMALGIMAFYAMVILAVTSYLRNHLKHWLWRAIHFLNPLAFLFVVIHGFFIGTDVKSTVAASIYLFSAFILAAIYAVNLISAISKKVNNEIAYENSDNNQE